MEGDQERLVFSFMDRQDRIGRPAPMSCAPIEPLGEAQELLRRTGDDLAEAGRSGWVIPRPGDAGLQTERRLFQHAVHLSYFAYLGVLGVSARKRRAKTPSTPRHAKRSGSSRSVLSPICACVFVTIG